jgi:hypothetical protein
LFRIHESGSDSESLVLTESKNIYFTKIGGAKQNHGPDSRGTSRTERSSTNFFFIPKFLESVKFFETSELFKKNPFYSSNFQEILTLEPNLAVKFQ